jgi:hypothetical protein
MELVNVERPPQGVYRPLLGTGDEGKPEPAIQVLPPSRIVRDDPAQAR